MASFERSLVLLHVCLVQIPLGSRGDLSHVVLLVRRVTLAIKFPSSYRRKIRDNNAAVARVQQSLIWSQPGSGLHILPPGTGC